MNIISIGEILWDVFEKEEHIGGACFNFAAHAARLGHNVLFISSVGEDERGERALKRATELGLSTEYIRRTKEAPTGHVTVHVNSSGQPKFTIHRPAAYDFPSLDAADIQKLTAWQPDCIYFGTLSQLSTKVWTLTKQLIEANPRARRYYDINLRRECYTPRLVRQLMTDASVLKINEDEVELVREMYGEARTSLAEFCSEYSTLFCWEGVVITRGANGCALFLRGKYSEFPGVRVKVADTVGAGDAFAAAFLHGLCSQWPADKIADFANRLGALVASRAGAVPPWTLKELESLPA
jgi:fructokinase